MKKIFIMSAMAFSAILFAQKAGSTGELLKNEATKTEMQTEKKEIVESKTQRRTSDNATNRNGNTRKYQTKDYQWRQNFGNAEVFLRIPERGYFTVEVGNQVISNTTGKFRFFDLNAGNTPISIYENGFLLYRTHLPIRNNTRLILDFFTYEGLYLLDAYPIQGETYGFSEWDDIWNNPYANTNVMSPRQFADFLDALDRNASFDEGRSRFIHQQLRTTRFTSEQIYNLLKKYSFDENKLKMAKQLYPQCVDKTNFYRVYDAFSFDSYKRELSEYISNR